MTLWLVGAGSMAQEYVRVLQRLGATFQIIGRGTGSAKSLQKNTGHAVSTGGVEKALMFYEPPDQAIVAVGVDQLAATATELIRAGTRRVLVEKPGGLDIDEIFSLNELAQEFQASVFIAYNRRHFGSVRQLRDCIAEDGGVLSAQFEFTEWSTLVESLVQCKNVKERWLLANSTHVIDLAFHLIGRPVDWQCWHSGSLNWHPASARFSGAGMTDQNVLFSYLADWQAPGRWGLELLTARRRLILRPMETLQAIPLGSCVMEAMPPLDNLDQTYKPGLYCQTEMFLNGDESILCTLKDQVENMAIYSRIAGYR